MRLARARTSVALRAWLSHQRARSRFLFACLVLLFAQSYVLYPGTLLVGPGGPFAEYAAFIERKGVRRRCSVAQHAAPR